MTNTLSNTFSCNGSDVTVSTTQREGESWEEFKARHDGTVDMLKACCKAAG